MAAEAFVVSGGLPLSVTEAPALTKLSPSVDGSKVAVAPSTVAPGISLTAAAHSNT